MSSEPIIIETTAALGALIRETRRAAGLTQAQAAGLSGVGTRFFSELERGKATLEIGRVLQVLDRLGLVVLVGGRPSRVRANKRATKTEGRESPR